MSVSTNITPFLRGLEAAHERIKAAAVQAVDTFGLKILGDAKDLCPVDTGFLSASATEEPAVLEGEGITKQLGFNASYAIFVHENLNAHHPQGQAKFLYAAIVNNKPQFDAYVGGIIANAMKGSL